MSEILEQAIVDASALKEVALKNAEAEVLEKYSDKIKKAVETLLEQDETLETQEEGISLEVGEQIPLSATDGENVCPCPDTDEDVEVTIDFDELRSGMEAEGEPDLPVEPIETDEEAAEDILGLMESEDSELNIEELDLESIVEKLTVDIESQKSGWAGGPSQSEYVFAEQELLALQQDTEVKEELAAVRKAVKSLQEEKNTLKLENSKLNENIKEVSGLFSLLKENLAETSTMNARLLYTNKVLGDVSLNERQKNKLVESISKAESVEEAKLIYETLQSAAGSSIKRQPKSLSEAVNKATSTMLLSNKKETKKYNPHSERWRILAGLNKN